MLACDSFFPVLTNLCSATGELVGHCDVLSRQRGLKLRYGLDDQIPYDERYTRGRIHGSRS